MLLLLCLPEHGVSFVLLYVTSFLSPFVVGTTTKPHFLLLLPYSSLYSRISHNPLPRNVFVLAKSNLSIVHHQHIHTPIPYPHLTSPCSQPPPATIPPLSTRTRPESTALLTTPTHPTQVTKSKTWKDIAGLLGIGASSSAAYTLRKHYTKNLLAFECHFDRGGIDPLPIIQQVEAGSKKKTTTKAASVPSPGMFSIISI